jgi:hypothetical protein
MLLIFKKHEHSECIIHAFALAFAFETTRAKRVPLPLILSFFLLIFDVFPFFNILNIFKHF